MDWKQKAKKDGLVIVKLAVIGLGEGFKVVFPFIQTAFKSIGKDHASMSKKEKDDIVTGWFLFALPVTVPLFFYILYKVVMFL